MKETWNKINFTLSKFHLCDIIDGSLREMKLKVAWYIWKIDHRWLAGGKSGKDSWLKTKVC